MDKAYLDAAISMAKEVQALVEFIGRIQAALGTEETGEALIEVARNAHRCELELASNYNFDDEPFDVMATIDADHSDTFK